MEDNRLGSFRSDVNRLTDDELADGAEADQEIQASIYHQEINTLKIEKLSNRVTIISVIIPCIITAILAFAYLDMKERVVDMDETKGTQVEQLAKKLDEKLNALDVRIAEVKFQLEEALPAMEKKRQALENQLAKISVEKADQKAFQSEIQKLAKQVRINGGQNKTTLAAMERINQDLLAAIKENNTQFKSKSDQIKEEMQLFKEEFDARLMELSAYEQQIAQLTKSVSLLDKQVKTLEPDLEKRMEHSIDQLRQTLEQRIQAVEAASQKAAAQTPSTQGAPKPTPSKGASASKPIAPVPQLDTGGSQPEAESRESVSGTDISEKPLSQ